MLISFALVLKEFPLSFLYGCLDEREFLKLQFCTGKCLIYARTNAAQRLNALMAQQENSVQHKALSNTAADRGWTWAHRIAAQCATTELNVPDSIHRASRWKLNMTSLSCQPSGQSMEEICTFNIFL